MNGNDEAILRRVLVGGPFDLHLQFYVNHCCIIFSTNRMRSITLPIGGCKRAL